MSAEKTFRLKTFHGTDVFYDPERGLYHEKKSEAPRVLLEMTDDRAKLFTLSDGRRLDLIVGADGKLTPTEEPAETQCTSNPDGTLSIIRDKKFLSARRGTGLFDLRPKNLDWEHFTLEFAGDLVHGGGASRHLPVEPDRCAGCTACATVCPKGAIVMREDAEGFQAPTFDPSLCVECGQCEKVCPILHPNKNPAPAVSYAAWIDDDAGRERSSSGGVAYALSRAIVEQGGVVCGAAIENFVVKHIIVDNVDGLIKLQGTKYVQSDLGDNFVEIEKLLSAGRKVLFVGTPCQVAGLKNFLRGRDENLTTVDLVCHGAPSPGVLRRYIAELRRRHPTAANVSFRDNIRGWSTAYAFALSDATGENVFKEANAVNPYLKGFIGNVIDRRSCGQCPFSTKERVGDITVGDYWGITKHNPALNDGKGTSLVFVNTDRGRKLYDSIADRLTTNEEVPADFAVSKQPSLRKPSAPSTLRAEFFDHFARGGAVENYLGDRLFPIGILNLCNSSNMGAVLVAYALSRAVEQLGYSAMIINAFPIATQAPTLKGFRKCHLNLSAPCSTQAQFAALNASLKKIIVGSDQVWKYGHISANMLDWAWGRKLFISYAASFGDAHYAGRRVSKERTKSLLGRFDWLSVREASGVDICRNEFDLDAFHVIDPTMLLRREHYDALINPKLAVKPDKPYVAHMFLGDTNRLIAGGDGFKDIREKYELWNVLTDEDGNMRSVSSWLAGIRDAEYVITNSFHGTVFSILFNKQFAVVAAPNRGADRLPSLIKMLHLPTNRFHRSFRDVSLKSFETPIDYEKVNLCVEKEREKGFMFLRMALSTPPTWKEPV